MTFRSPIGQAKRDLMALMLPLINAPRCARDAEIDPVDQIITVLTFRTTAWKLKIVDVNQTSHVLHRRASQLPFRRKKMKQNSFNSELFSTKQTRWSSGRAKSVEESIEQTLCFCSGR